MFSQYWIFWGTNRRKDLQSSPVRPPSVCGHWGPSPLVPLKLSNFIRHTGTLITDEKLRSWCSPGRSLTQLGPQKPQRNSKTWADPGPWRFHLQLHRTRTILILDTPGSVRSTLEAVVTFLRRFQDTAGYWSAVSGSIDRTDQWLISINNVSCSPFLSIRRKQSLCSAVNEASDWDWVCVCVCVSLRETYYHHTHNLRPMKEVHSEDFVFDMRAWLCPPLGSSLMCWCHRGAGLGASELKPLHREQTDRNHSGRDVLSLWFDGLDSSAGTWDRRPAATERTDGHGQTERYGAHMISDDHRTTTRKRRDVKRIIQKTNLTQWTSTSRDALKVFLISENLKNVFNKYDNPTKSSNCNGINQ